MASRSNGSSPDREDHLTTLDISGSMNALNQTFVGAGGISRAGTRLGQAKAELIKSVMSLSENFVQRARLRLRHRTFSPPATCRDLRKPRRGVVMG
jgi:hypothetical protein